MNTTPRRTRLAALVAVGVTAVLAGCWDSPTDLRLAPNLGGPNLATAVGGTNQLAPWTPPQVDGVYLLPKACDVFIGDPNIEGQVRYRHQLLVSLPAGTAANPTRVKLVSKADHPGVTWPAYPYTEIPEDPIVTTANGYKVFRCSAEDPDNPGRPVVEPVTDHAGKGDGIIIETDGVQLDLNGFGMIASPSATELDPRYDNIGLVVGANNVRLINSADIGGDGKAGVAYFDGWGHSIEVAGNNPIVSGKRVGTNPETALYNIFATGGMGIKLASGNVLVENVKNVDRDLVIGVGFEVLRCAPGSVTIVQNSHFVGAADGVFVRRCDNVKVVVQNNFISAPIGLGVYAREVNGASGVVDRRLQILNNTIRNASRINSMAGIHLDQESSYITVTGNTIGGFFCGIQVANQKRNPNQRIQGIATNPTLESTNFFVPAPSATDPAAVLDRTCGGTYAPPANNPPVITLATPICTEAGLCTFGATVTDPDGNAISRYEWNFGDGTTGLNSPAGWHQFTGAVPATTLHQYLRGGTFLVTLRAYDQHGLGEEAQVTVQLGPLGNLPPSASYDADCVGFQCTFTSVSEDPDGDALTLSWDFGDNTTGTGVTVTKTFAAGTYWVTLTATDPGGLSGTYSFPNSHRLPNQRPVAGFTYQCSGLDCTFTSTSSDPDTDDELWVWEWDFGGLGRSSDQGPVTFGFPAPGTYVVKHGVRDWKTDTPSGEVTQSVTVTAPTGPQPPTASFGWTCNGLTCQFNDFSTDPDGDISSWSWSFGDGTTSNQQSPQKTYAAAGTYSVQLLVTDAGGRSNFATQQVTPTAPAKLSQTITFAQPASPATFGTTFNVSPTASSGLPVSVGTSGGCSAAPAASGWTVTMTSGTTACTLTATQLGDAQYNAAPSVVHTVAAAKATATLALGNLSQTYNGSPRPATVTTTPANLSGVSVTYNGSATAPTNAGSYAVVASLSNDDYSATNATGTLVVAKAAGSISITGPSTLVQNTTGQILASRTGDGAVTYAVTSGQSVCSVNSTTGVVTMNAPSGSCAIQATLAEGTNHLGATSNTVTITAQAPSAFGPINLTGSLVSIGKGGKEVRLNWTGAVGSQVTVRRTLGTNVTTFTAPNTGSWSEPSPALRGTYNYQVCNLELAPGASTPICSNTVNIRI